MTDNIIDIHTRKPCDPLPIANDLTRKDYDVLAKAHNGLVDCCLRMSQELDALRTQVERLKRPWWWL